MHSIGRRIILIIMIGFIWSLANVSAQIPTGSQASAKISGKVLGADGKPVAGANLSLRTSGSNARQAGSATTDESGTFAFSNLAPGDYFLSAAKGAYVYQGFTSKDQANPTDTAPIRIERGSESVAVTIVLQKGGVITGKITDDRGDPVVGANVQITIKEKEPTAQIILQSLKFFTDDRGLYRLYGLPTGQYFVAVDPKGFVPLPAGSDLPMTYYPGVISKDEAQEVVVTAGAEIGGIDFKVSPVRKMAKVFGQIVRRADGSPLANIGIVAFKETEISPQVQPTDRDGRFEFKNLSAGTYTLVAVTQDTKLTERTVRQVTLASDPVEVTIEVDDAAEISGRCELEGGRKVATVEGLTVMMMPEGDQVGQLGQLSGLNRYAARPSSDGSFTFTRLPSGSYRILLRSEKSKYYLSRIVYEDADITDEPLAIESGRKIAGVRLILSDESGTLRGVVIDRAGAVAAGATVMVVPLDADLRRSGRNNRAALSDHRGSVLIEGIAPGKYRIFAVRDPKRLVMDKAALEELLSAHPEFPIVEVRAREVQQARVPVID